MNPLKTSKVKRFAGGFGIGFVILVLYAVISVVLHPYQGVGLLLTYPWLLVFFSLVAGAVVAFLPEALVRWVPVLLEKLGRRLEGTESAPPDQE